MTTFSCLRPMFAVGLVPNGIADISFRGEMVNCGDNSQTVYGISGTFLIQLHSSCDTPFYIFHYSIFSVPIHRWGVVLSDSLNISLVIQPSLCFIQKPYRLSETFVHVPLLKRECRLHGSICRATFKRF